VGNDPVSFSFDEYGHDSYQTFSAQDGSSIPPSGSTPSFESTATNPGIPVPGGYLTYTLPSAVTVHSGNIYVLSQVPADATPASVGQGIYEVTASDINHYIEQGIQFFSSNGTSYLQYYANGPAGAPAAGGSPSFPSGFLPMSSETGNAFYAVIETGGNFVYDCNSSGVYRYNVFSGTVVPEPSRVIGLLGLLGFGGFYLAFRSRTKNKAVRPVRV